MPAAPSPDQSPPNHHPTREAWLADVAARLAPAFAQLGAPLPPRLRVSIGVPSAGRSARSIERSDSTPGSADATVDILVRPDVTASTGGDDPALAHATALARAFISAAVGTGTDQGPARRRLALALALGLLGPVHAAKPGPAFRALVAPVLDAVGPLPRARLPSHAAGDAGSGLDGDGIPARPRAKQASRHMRCACPACGYVARTARKWLARGRAAPLPPPRPHAGRHRTHWHAGAGRRGPGDARHARGHRCGASAQAASVEIGATGAHGQPESRCHCPGPDPARLHALTTAGHDGNPARAGQSELRRCRWHR